MLDFLGRPLGHHLAVHHQLVPRRRVLLQWKRQVGGRSHVKAEDKVCRILHNKILYNEKKSAFTFTFFGAKEQYRTAVAFFTQIKLFRFGKSCTFPLSSRSSSSSKPSSSFSFGGFSMDVWTSSSSSSDIVTPAHPLAVFASVRATGAAGGVLVILGKKLRKYLSQRIFFLHSFISLLELQLCFSQRFYTCRIFLGRRIAKGEHQKSNALTKTFCLKE